MDFCKCCGNDDPKAESLDCLYKRSDCVQCGKEKRSKAIKPTGLAKAVLAIEARRKQKMATKQRDSGPKINIGYASRVPVNKAKAQMRPVNNCKCCGMQQKKCPGDEANLAQMMVGHFGKEIASGGDTVVMPGHKKSQKACAVVLDMKKSLKIPNDQQLITIKVPLLEPKISETTLVCNSLNTEELEPRQSYVLHSSTGAINKSHNFMKFSEHKSKGVPPLSKILSDLTLCHSACGEQRKPPQEEPNNPGDVRFDTEHDPYDNDSMLVFPLKYVDDKFKYQFVDDFSDYYTPESETSPTIETICYNSSKLSQNSSSCPCVVQSKKLNQKYHSPKVWRPSYFHNLKLFNNQYDSVKGIQVVKNQREEGAKVVSIPKSNDVNKPPKTMGILGGMKTKTTNKNPTERPEPCNLQPIHKLPVSMTRHDQNVKNKTEDEKFGICLRRNDKKIAPKVEGPKKKCINGILGGMETERTGLKTTQTRNSCGSLKMHKPCVAKACHKSYDQNVLEKGEQVIKNTKSQDKNIVNITFQSNGNKIPPQKIEDSKKKCNNGVLEGKITERTGLKPTQTKTSYGSMKVHDPCGAKTCRTRQNENFLKTGEQVVKDKIQDKNIVNITFQSNVKKTPPPKVEAPKKKCNNGIFGGMKTERSCVKTTQKSNINGSAKIHEPCTARSHFDLSQKEINILKKQGLSLRSRQTGTGIIVNNKNKSLKYCSPPRGVKRLDTQLQTKQLNKPTKENEVLSEARGYLRLHQATSGINSVAGTESPKCEPPRRVLAKSDTPRTGDINTAYIKKRGKLDLPVYEPRTSFDKSPSYSYKPPEASKILKVPDIQETLTNSNAHIKELQSLKAQQIDHSLETIVNTAVKTPNNKVITQKKDACELKRNINATNSLTMIKSKQASEKILRKSLWTKFTTCASQEKVVEKLNAKKPDKRHSMTNTKIQTQSTKPSCSVNIKELSPRMRILLGIHPQKVPQTDNQKCMQQNASHPTGIVLKKKQSKICQPKVEYLQEQVDHLERSIAGNTLSPIMNELHNQKEPCSTALQLNATGPNNLLIADQVELKENSTVIKHQISKQDPEDFNYNKTSIEKTPMPDKHIGTLTSNNLNTETLFVEEIQKNDLGKEEPKIISLGVNKYKKEIKTVKPRTSKLKIIHNHTPKRYPDTVKKLIKNQRSTNISPVAKTSMNRLAKTTQLHPTPVQKLGRLKTKPIVGKQMGHSKIPKYSTNYPINLTNSTPTSTVANQINPSNPIESLLGNLQHSFIEMSKEEVDELELQPKQCTILMKAIEIGFKRTGHMVQVAPSQQQLAKMVTIVLSENRNVEEDEPKVMDNTLLDDLYIKRRGSMIWADPVKEEQPVGCKLPQNIIEINLENISKHSTELTRAPKEEENHVKLYETRPKVKPTNLNLKYVVQTSLDKDNMSEIPERSLPKVIQNIKRNSMIWADPAKEEQQLGCIIPRNNIEINHKKDSKHTTALAKTTKEEENQENLYKMPPKVKPKNLRIGFVDQASVEEDNFLKIPESKPKVKGKLKSLPNQTKKERKTVLLKSLTKKISGRKNTKCESNTSSDTFYTCRQGYLTSPRHCGFPKYPENNKQKNATGLNVSKKPDFPKHPKNNELKKSSTKNATDLNLSMKSDFPKHPEDNKMKKSSTKKATGLTVSKKPDFPKHPENNKLKNLSTKNATGLNLSMKPDFPKHPEDNKMKKSSTKNATGLNVTKKPDFPKHLEHNKLKNSSTKNATDLNISKKPDFPKHPENNKLKISSTKNATDLNVSKKPDFPKHPENNKLKKSSTKNATDLNVSKKLEFPKHPENNKLKISSTKNATDLNVSKKPDFPKHPEDKLKKSSTTKATGFNVSKKPTKQCIKNYVCILKSSDRGFEKFNNNPIPVSKLYSSIHRRAMSKSETKKKILKDLEKQSNGKVKLGGTRLLKVPKNPEAKVIKNLKFDSSTQKNKGNIQKLMRNSSSQDNSAQEYNEMALVKYQRGHDQLSTTSMTDYADEAKKHCPFEFRNPGIVAFDLKFFRDVYLMIESNLTNANLNIVIKSFMTENLIYPKKQLDDGTEQTSSENRRNELQPYRYQESDLARFMVPYMHTNCCIHNCGYEVNGSNILGHIAQCHLDWFGFKESKDEWQTIFNDSEVMFSINPNKYVLGEISFVGLLAYGGDRDKEPPVVLEQCPKNTLLPASMHEIIQYCPIVLYGCKLPVVIQKPKRKSSSKKKRANNERLVIWASSFPLPFKIEFKISVQSKDFSNSRSQTMHVRYFHKTTQNPSQFGRYDNDFLCLYYDELKALTNRFKNEFDLVMSIQELK